MANLKKLPVIIDDGKYRVQQLLDALYKHLEYSFNDIDSYDELTEEEKKIIPKEMFEYLAEKENNICGYTMTCTNGIFNFCTMTKHFKSLRKAIEKAKEVQNKFCEESEFVHNFPHKFCEMVNGRTYYSIFDEINGCGKFLTEDEFSNRLLIEIEKIEFED